jgi:hypothetical protein
MLELPYSIKVLDSIPLDAYYYNTSGQPYTNTAQVTSQVTSGVRYRGQTFNVAGVEYWFGAGTTNGDLIVKHPYISGTLSANRIPYATGASALADGPHWDNTNTRLGIGAAPSHPLHVTRNQNASTNIVITNTDTTNGSSRSQFLSISATVQTTLQSIGTGASAGSYVGSLNGHSLFLVSGSGMTNATLNTSGNFGVGIAPSYRVHASHNQNATTSISVTNTDVTNANSRAQFYAESGTLNSSLLAVGVGAAAGTYIGSNTNHNTHIMANGSAKITVTPAGVVNISTLPANDDALTNVLVRDAVTGDVKYRTAASFIVDGDKGDITVSSSGTTWSLDPDVLNAGAYTPIATGIANVTDITPGSNHRHALIFGQVIVYGQFSLDPTLAATPTTFRFSLPYASNLTLIDSLSGVATSADGLTCTIQADTTNDEALFTINPVSANATTFTYTYMYLIN